MFRRLPFFGQRAYPAPALPVIVPAARPDGPAPVAAEHRDLAGEPRPAASARALEFAAAMQRRGVAMPVLMARFPHVVDRIASASSNPPRLARVFQALLFDDRGVRGGFPEEAAAELFALHRASLGDSAKPIPERSGPQGTPKP